MTTLSPQSFRCGVVHAGRNRQFVRKIVRFLGRSGRPIAPFRLSATIVVVLLAVLTVTVLNGVVLKFAMRTMNNTFESVNDEMTPDSSRPTTPLRSGAGHLCRGSRWATRAESL